MSIYDDAKDSGGVYVRPLFVKLAGDLVTGTLLSQLAYWFQPDKSGKKKLKVVVDGQQWLAKSREDLCTECCISLDQYRRAIKVLVDKGFVKTRVKLYGGKTTPHFWLDEAAMETALQLTASPAPEPPAPTDEVSSPNHLGDNAPTTKGIIPQPCLGDNASTNTESEIEPEQTTDMHTLGAVPEQSHLLGAVKEPPWPVWMKKCPIDFSTGISTDTHTGVAVKADEVLKQHKGGGWPNTPGGCALRWKSRMATMYGFQKDLTIKDRAMLKQVLEVGKEQTGPLIDYVTQQWLSFAGYVKQKKGLGIAPQVPDLGFLVKHVDLGLQLIAEEEEEPAPKAKVKYVMEDVPEVGNE